LAQQVADEFIFWHIFAAASAPDAARERVRNNKD